MLPVPVHRPHILVIEDDPAIGDMLTLLLESVDYAVTWCASATTARAVLMPAPDACAAGLDLILLDLTLGTSSGVVLMQEVATVRHRLPPIIVLSAGAPAVLAAAATTLGAQGLLPKPFLPDALLAAVATALAN